MTGRASSAPPEIIDPAAYARRGYPHEAWARLRAEAPVARCEAPGFPPFWAVTKHADVIALSRSPERFRNAPMMAVFPREQYEAETFPFRHLLNMDPPEHRAYRRLLSGRFTPRASASLRASVEAVVAETLDGLGAGGELDFVEAVSGVVPIAVIADMLGIPAGERARFFRWTNQIIAGTDAEYQEGRSTEETTERAVRELFDCFREMVAERRRAPRDDLTSLLARAQLDGAPLPEWELLSYLALVVVAGNETTRNATSGGLLALLEHPGEFERLRRSPELLDTAVEEILRWTTPVVQMARTPVEEVRLRGVRIPAGEPLCLFYASANRDEEVFDEPFRFRVDRRPNRHLAFGVGEHVCMGAHLARLELKVILARLLERLESLERAGPAVYQHSSFVGGIKHLPVRMRLRRPPAAA